MPWKKSVSDILLVFWPEYPWFDCAYWQQAENTVCQVQDHDNTAVPLSLGKISSVTVLSCVTFLARLLCKTENMLAWSHICACEIPLGSKGRHHILWPHTRWLTFPALIPSQLSELFLVVCCSLTTTRLWAQCLTLLPQSSKSFLWNPLLLVLFTFVNVCRLYHCCDF